MSESTILPANATPLERALADLLSSNLPAPGRTLANADDALASFLPFMAAAEGVRLWFEDWSDDRKREMIRQSPTLNAIVGSKVSADSFLPFVDAEIVHKLTHPSRFVLGRAALGITPFAHKPHVTHFLVRVPLKMPARGMIMRRSYIGRCALRTPDGEPLRRVRMALMVSKAPEKRYSVNYGHRRPVTLGDGFPLDGSFRIGGFMDRTRI